VAGLTGLDIEVEKQSLGQSPFDRCQAQFRNYLAVATHDHSSHEAYQWYRFEQLGNFWAAVICDGHEMEQWPTVRALLCENKLKGRVRARPLTQDWTDQI
jgi:hypothetical protein